MTSLTPPLPHTQHIGNSDLLKSPLTGILCSTACPGGVILKAHDLALVWAKQNRGVVGGFHSPIEAEMLTVLLRGQGPLVVVAARGLGNMRLPPEWKPALDGQRLLVVSPFKDAIKRADQRLAEQRNRLVGELANQMLVLHAAPESKTEKLALTWLQDGRTIYTLDHPSNQNLLDAGALVWAQD